MDGRATGDRSRRTRTGGRAEEMAEGDSGMKVAAGEED